MTELDGLAFLLAMLWRSALLLLLWGPVLAMACPSCLPCYCKHICSNSPSCCDPPSTLYLTLHDAGGCSSLDGIVITLTQTGTFSITWSGSTYVSALGVTISASVVCTSGAGVISAACDSGGGWHVGSWRENTGPSCEYDNLIGPAAGSTFCNPASASYPKVSGTSSSSAAIIFYASGCTPPCTMLPSSYACPWGPGADPQAPYYGFASATVSQ